LWALSLWLTASPPVSAALREEERAAWTTFAGGSPGGEASVLTDEQALAAIARGFEKETPARKEWDTYWTNHGQQILDVEPYYQAKGAREPLTSGGHLLNYMRRPLTDTLLRMSKILSAIDSEHRNDYFKGWEKDGTWITAKAKIKLFPKGLGLDIVFLKRHVDAMPDAFVHETLDLFLAILWALRDWSDASNAHEVLTGIMESNRGNYCFD